MSKPKTMGEWVNELKAIPTEADAISFLRDFAKDFNGERPCSEIVQRMDYFGVVVPDFWVSAIERVEPTNNWAAKRLKHLLDRPRVERLNMAAPALLAAAKTVLRGLNARIDNAVTAGEPVPVFDGIAELHDAIGKAEAAQ